MSKYFFVFPFSNETNASVRTEQNGAIEFTFPIPPNFSEGLKSELPAEWNDERCEEERCNSVSDRYRHYFIPHH